MSHDQITLLSFFRYEFPFPPSLLSTYFLFFLFFSLSSRGHFVYLSFPFFGHRSTTMMFTTMITFPFPPSLPPPLDRFPFLFISSLFVYLLGFVICRQIISGTAIKKYYIIIFPPLSHETHAKHARSLHPRHARVG